LPPARQGDGGTFILHIADIVNKKKKTRKIKKTKKKKKKPHTSPKPRKKEKGNATNEKKKIHQREEVTVQTRRTGGDYRDKSRRGTSYEKTDAPLDPQGKNRLFGIQ